MTIYIVVSCPVQTVPNGMVTYTLPSWWSNQEVHDRAVLHTIATWTCNSGYLLYGAQSMTCLSNWRDQPTQPTGYWNKPTPTCRGNENQN